MKKLILITGVVFTTIVFVSCGNSKRVLINDVNYSEINTKDVVADSTKVPGYNAKQRAFYWYLMSLNEKERKEWTEGAYSEKELSNFKDTIEVKNGIK
jgi:hypothetical protein